MKRVVYVAALAAGLGLCIVSTSSVAEGRLANPQRVAPSADTFIVRFVDGQQFAGSVDSVSLAAGHAAPYKLQPGQVGLETPVDAAAIAARLHRDYRHDYKLAIKSTALTPASRCIQQCATSFTITFLDGARAWVDLDGSKGQISLIAVEGLPVSDDADAVARVVAFVRTHPGMGNSTKEFKAAVGHPVRSSFIYFYAESSMLTRPDGEVVPPPPPPPFTPPPPGVRMSVSGCKAMGSTNEATNKVTSGDELSSPWVTVVLDDRGSVTREWISRSSGSYEQDNVALDQAAKWKFIGFYCQGYEYSSVVTYAQDPALGGLLSPSRSPASAPPISSSSILLTHQPSIDLTYASQHQPKYPPEAIRAHHEGVVLVLVRVGVYGRVTAIAVDRSSGYPELDEAAVSAVRDWKFNSAAKGGSPVVSLARVPINFAFSKETATP